MKYLNIAKLRDKISEVHKEIEQQRFNFAGFVEPELLAEMRTLVDILSCFEEK